MALVKAKMAFYHDSVGTHANNEVFEVRNEKVCAELERAGYVQKVEGQEAQAHEQRQKLQQEVGKRNGLTNEAVSLANHVHNVEANNHTEQVKQMRQQQASQEAQQEQQQNSNAQRTTAKKAEK